jgi:hypothetical protein
MFIGANTTIRHMYPHTLTHTVTNTLHFPNPFRYRTVVGRCFVKSPLNFELTNPDHNCYMHSSHAQPNVLMHGSTQSAKSCEWVWFSSHNKVQLSCVLSSTTMHQFLLYIHHCFYSLSKGSRFHNCEQINVGGYLL